MLVNIHLWRTFVRPLFGVAITYFKTDKRSKNEIFFAFWFETERISSFQKLMIMFNEN